MLIYWILTWIYSISLQYIQGKKNKKQTIEPSEMAGDQQMGNEKAQLARELGMMTTPSDKQLYSTGHFWWFMDCQMVRHYTIQYWSWKYKKSNQQLEDDVDDLMHFISLDYSI